MTITIGFEPSKVQLLSEEPLSISEAARQAGVSLKSVCGGKTICGKCRVRVQGGALPPPSPAEQEHLSEEQLADGWRLACRTILFENATVYVPVASKVEAQVLQVDSLELELNPKPAVRILPVAIPPPSLGDQVADMERVADALSQRHGIAGGWADLPALKALRLALREGNWQISTALRGNELIAAYPGTVPLSTGLAVDVGTTKLACYLVDLITGQTLAAKGVMNPQIAYGEDVMNRLEAVMVDPAQAEQLQQDVIEAINTVAAELCDSQGITPTCVLDICLVGNTAMHHLLAGLPTRPLAVVPFVPALSSPLDIHARQLGLLAAPGARVYLPPPIAGFVGSDHLAFLLAADFGKDNRTKLGIDIGTNTEIALQAGDRIVSCSTASGPAFEGAHIRQGMRAAPGAIERVKIGKDGSIRFHVIGDKPASGICGSGILDILAELYRANIINERGRLNPNKPGVRQQSEKLPEFVLAAARNGRHEIAVAQEDIDQVLLAKGAIRAGINILMNALNVKPDQIDEVVIAGAFGTYLDPYNAVRIGLLPQLPLNRIQAVGNAAGAGARMLLASTEVRSRAANLAKRIEYLELTVHPGFNKYFAHGVRLPSF